VKPLLAESERSSNLLSPAHCVTWWCVEGSPPPSGVLRSSSASELCPVTSHVTSHVIFVEVMCQSCDLCESSDYIIWSCDLRKSLVVKVIIITCNVHLYLYLCIYTVSKKTDFQKGKFCL